MEALDLGQTIEQRRLVWPEIQARLTLAGINKEDSAKAKSYFLRGREPTIKVHGESFMDDDPMPLVIRLWLHPDTSDASMCAIVERVLAYPHNGVITRSMRESKRLLDQIASTHHFNGVDAPHGWLAGHEERIARFLLGSDGGGKAYSYRWNAKDPDTRCPLYHFDGFGEIYYSQLQLWLGDASVETMHAGVNEFIWTRYLHGLWHDWLVAQPDPLPAIFDAHGRYKSATVKYFQAVHRVLQGAVVFDDADRLAYCQDVAGYIADPAMPACVVQWWQEAAAA